VKWWVSGWLWHGKGEFSNQPKYSGSIHTYREGACSFQKDLALAFESGHWMWWVVTWQAYILNDTNFMCYEPTNICYNDTGNIYNYHGGSYHHWESLSSNPFCLVWTSLAIF